VKRREQHLEGHTYFLIMERFGAMMGFPKHMAFIKLSGKDCSSRKDPYITRSAILKTLSASTSRALCFTTPLGYFNSRAIA
jgi:hypothetical protein